MKKIITTGKYIPNRGSGSVATELPPIKRAIATYTMRKINTKKLIIEVIADEGASVSWDMNIKTGL